SAASDQIRRAAPQEHEAAVGEQVTAEHPLQALDREVQVVLDRGKGDVDDRRIDKVEKGDATQERERQLAAARGEERRFGGHMRDLRRAVGDSVSQLT